ncbi:sulfotransferase [Sphaerisporangium sp. TRM90804]|uniref:sulfotransferase domain-containing protein n=1 Tax=Sphaerisporangium sp. TRM90804 TaxID=3031113 RepID=UPI00244B9247|nr:sulfotransferase [Sphaerisporangium sp. TRM90804]MDH2428753.1 sulfotransferase domain-containing protein [Sphaerisporangium sp. TRM90804]
MNRPTFRQEVPPVNRTVKRSAHVVSYTAGRLTVGGRLLPSFLIVGAQRCGTTSLYRTLARHPLVLKPALRKGVHYFDVAYGRGPAWYRAHFPLKATANRLERRYGTRPPAFESSPYYMFHPLAAARIARDLPGVKLVVLVRDPVERAYSAHAHEVARGFEPEPSFERAVELEEHRLAGEHERLANDPHATSHAHRHHAYLARGRYACQLAELERQVGRLRLLVVDSGRFFRTPEPVYDQVLEFLGLPRLGDPLFEHHNARPRPADMPVSLRRRLSAHFEPWDTQLEAWLDTTPSWRL